MSNNLRRYPNNLYAIRRIRGYRQKVVAHLLGHKDTDMVSLYERGVVLPPLHIAIKLTMILSAELSELYPQLYDLFERELQSSIALLHKGSRRPRVGGGRRDNAHEHFGTRGALT